MTTTKMTFSVAAISHETVEFKNAKKDGLMITCSMVLESADGDYHADLTIQLVQKLEGGISTRVQGTVSAGPDTAMQDLKFIRRE